MGYNQPFNLVENGKMKKKIWWKTAKMKKKFGGNLKISIFATLIQNTIQT
jgi:hypothetical protein